VKRLKVAVVTDALYPWHKGGKEVRYLRLLNRLPEYEMDVVVYSMRWWSETPEAIEYPRGSLEYKSICPRVPMYRGTRRSLLQALLFAGSTFRLLTRKFDVIEADHMPYLQLLPLRLVAWVRRVPLVVTWHEVWGKEGWRTYVGRAGFAPALLERFCMRLPDAIVAVSVGTAEKLVAMGAKSDRVHVVPNSLDFDELNTIEPQSPAPELLFIGRLLEHKHADLAIEATGMLSTRGHDVHLGIVGVGPEEARLRALVKNLGLETRVSFLLTLDSQRDLWSLLRGSRVLLAPSVREGFGLVVAESLALGTPVVCVLHPENESANLIGPMTGSITPPFDAEALADAAEFWLLDVSQRADRISVFIAEHGESVLDEISKSYAEIFRNLTTGLEPRE
jgi:glycosyltransferase involved in cell wall biosynthesis